MPPTGDTVLGTTTADPNFYARKIGALGDALGGAFAAERRRREQQEQRELQEIQDFTQMALKFPELATSQGPAMRAKYGQKYPQLGPILSVLENKEREASKIRGAGESYFAALEGIESKYAQDRAALDAMPDEVPVQVPVPSFVTKDAYPMGTIEVPTPNLEKAKRQAQLEHVQPALFAGDALRMLAPADRHRVRLIPGLDLPHDFDPYGDDVPPEQRAYLAAITGQLQGGPAQVASIGVKMEQSPAELRKQEYDTSEREAKHEQAVEEQKQRTTDSRDLSRQTDAQTRGRMAYGEEIQNRLIGRRGEAAHEGRSGGRKGKEIWEQALGESKALLDEWQEGLNAITAGGVTKSGKRERAEAAVAYRNATPRPAQLTREAAIAIQRRLEQRVAEGAMDKDDVPSAVALLVSRFSQLTRGGKVSSASALKDVLAREEQSIAGGQSDDEPLFASGH